MRAAGGLPCEVIVIIFFYLIPLRNNVFRPDKNHFLDYLALRSLLLGNL